jgi:hypothetical protein
VGAAEAVPPAANEPRPPQLASGSPSNSGSARRIEALFIPRASLLLNLIGHEPERSRRSQPRIAYGNVAALLRAFAGVAAEVGAK